MDLSGFVAGGEEIVISYEFGKDWCNGVEGWYVDDFEVYYCTCSTNADCDDGLYCNGEETCNDTLCEPGAAPCGLAYCDESADTCPPTVFWDNFENGNAQGWNLYAPDSQATTGIWEIGDPNGTLSGGAPAQPEFAFEGANCAFTETNGAGGVGDGDVDGGPVYLLSPVIDLSGQASAELRWVRWFYQRDIDDDAGDFFTVEASADGGNNWVAIETLDDFQSENDWNERSALLEDYIGLTADVRVRFGASDGTGEGDIIEAAVDNVAVLLTEEIECLPPSATVVSSRYLSVTPSAVGATVALRVSGAPGDPDVACLDAYVQSDGTLGANPFFQAPAAWGTVNVHGESIIPGATYEVRTECDTGISTLTSAPTSEQLWTWGDVEVNGIVNFADVQLVVQAFQGNFDNVTLEAADLEPCSPNQVVNFADIQRDVQAFQGQTYAQTNCPIPCP